MSRSYKKTLRSGDCKDKFFKNYANRKLRRNKFEDLQNGSYKKNFSSWQICDFNSLNWSFEEHWNMTLKRCSKWNLPIPNKKEIYRKWYQENKAK